MLHFAYGSNMSVPMMRRMCPAARCEGRAILPGYRVFIMREGYASIRRAPVSRSCVHGVLWRLTARDLAALNAYENLAGGLYRAAIMTVYADKRHAALVYVARRHGRGRPRPGYMEIVIAGAREAGLPARYVRDLARLANRPDLCQQTRRGPPRPLRPPRPAGGGGGGIKRGAE
jgi:gamma-glutamylcyclotransferase (GGCT)/AIG2-like uncharacterized protein YtfP